MKITRGKIGLFLKKRRTLETGGMKIVLHIID